MCDLFALTKADGPKELMYTQTIHLGAIQALFIRASITHGELLGRMFKGKNSLAPKAHDTICVTVWFEITCNSKNVIRRDVDAMYAQIIRSYSRKRGKKGPSCDGKSGFPRRGGGLFAKFCIIWRSLIFESPKCVFSSKERGPVCPFWGCTPMLGERARFDELLGGINLGNSGD